jgi:hypothetical protein
MIENGPRRLATAVSSSVAAVMAAIMAAVTVVLGGCVGGHFKVEDPGSSGLDAPTRVVMDRIGAERALHQLPAASWVPELRPPAVRGARAVARGEQSLKTAAHFAAQQGVTELGRHVWTFVTECTDLQQFHPPPLAIAQKSLLIGAAAVPGQAGRTVVLVVVAEPGPSALRADQMGGGTGGANPSLETYAHPSVARGACGTDWPAAQRAPL